MEICGFEIAKKLKEKGFREKCFAYYTNDDTLYFNYSHKAGACYTDCYLSHNLMPKDSVSGKFIDAPTISQVLKWLREKKIFIHIDVYENDKFDYFFGIAVQGDETWERKYIGEKDYKTYELAALAGIEYCLDNFI